MHAKDIDNTLKKLQSILLKVPGSEMGELVNDLIVTQNMPFELAWGDFYPLRSGYVIQASIPANCNRALGIAYTAEHGAYITLNEIEQVQYDMLHNPRQFVGGALIYSAYQPNFMPLLPLDNYEIVEVQHGASILIDTRPGMGKIWVSELNME